MNRQYNFVPYLTTYLQAGERMQISARSRKDPHTEVSRKGFLDCRE